MLFIRDASALKKRLLSRENKSRSSSIRDRLRIINFEIEDAARKLRFAKGEALAAIDKLEALELKHWSLLQQYEADQRLSDGEINVVIEEANNITNGIETNTTEVEIKESGIGNQAEKDEGNKT